MKKVTINLEVLVANNQTISLENVVNGLILQNNEGHILLSADSTSNILETIEITHEENLPDSSSMHEIKSEIPSKEDFYDMSEEQQEEVINKYLRLICKDDISRTVYRLTVEDYLIGLASYYKGDYDVFDLNSNLLSEFVRRLEISKWDYLNQTSSDCIETAIDNLECQREVISFHVNSSVKPEHEEFGEVIIKTMTGIRTFTVWNDHNGKEFCPYVFIKETQDCISFSEIVPESKWEHLLDSFWGVSKE